MGVIKAFRKSRPSPINLPSRIRHATRRKHYTHITLQSRILPLYRSIPYSLLLFNNSNPQYDHRGSMSDSHAVFRARPLFLPCPPPRTAHLEWASYVNLRSIVARMLADAKACVCLWEGMDCADAQGWGLGMRRSRPLDEKIARVFYFRRLLEDGKQVAGRQNGHGLKRKQSLDTASVDDDDGNGKCWKKRRRCG